MRRKTRFGWLAVALFPTLAMGQGWPPTDATGAEESVRSPQTSAFELKFGSFTPLLDREPALGGATPFADTFGNPSMLLFEMEYDQQLWRGFVGYAEKYAKAIVLNPTTSEPERSGETTALFVLPMRLMAVYRFDWAADKYGIPVVPYLKLGLNYSPWWITKAGDLEVVDGNSAIGGQWGYSGTAGLSFQLDILERRMAADFDNDVGVNHIYLFGEYTHSEVNNFGAGGLDLSSRHWMFGLALEI
jgi:hypothetical protein